MADGAALQSGAAYVFTRVGSTWTEAAKLTSSSGGSFDAFGMIVAVNGGTVIVGETPLGAAHVFASEGSTWVEQQALLLGDALLAASVDGDTAVFGTSSGALISTRVNGKWLDPRPLHELGRAVAVSGGHALVGEWGSSRDGIGSGAVDALALGRCNADAGADPCACKALSGNEPICKALSPPPDPVGSQCPAGYWRYVDEVCFESDGTCDPAGDGKCYKVCAANADCPDPCRPHCTRQGLHKGHNMCFSDGPLICSEWEVITCL